MEFLNQIEKKHVCNLKVWVEISNQIKKDMYGIKSIGGNFEPNRKKHVWNKKYGWKF